jgi:aconitate hydratase
MFVVGKIDDEIRYTGECLELQLESVEPCLSGPKRPHDRVVMTNMKKDFKECLTNKVGFKGYGLEKEHTGMKGKFKYEGKEYEIGHGSVVIAAITSCTNTSNANVMLAAAMLAKKAVEKGLSIAPYIKTSLSPGSGVVTEYFNKSGLQ